MKQVFIATLATIMMVSLGACSAKKEEEYKSPDSASVSYQTPAGLDVVLKDDSFGRVSLCTTGQEKLEHDFAISQLMAEVIRITDAEEIPARLKTVKYVAGYPLWGPHSVFHPRIPFVQECIFFGYGAGVGDTFVIYGEEKPSHYNGYLEWNP